MRKLMRLMSFWVCFLLWFFVISVFAYKEFNYNSAKNIAIYYIQNSSFDENWNWKNPKISGEWKYFYTDSNNPSYIEFKVSCDNEPNCWFIMVNFDGNDVSIPVSSTSWNTPSEVLEFKNGNKNNNFYYFSPFEQYAENEITWSVSSINPQDDEVLTNKTARSINIDNKSYKNNSLKEKLDNAKKESKKFKNSQEFKKLKKELKENKLTVPNEEISFKVLDMAMAVDWYVKPTSPNKFINSPSVLSLNQDKCKWYLPCYNQFKTTYSWVTCDVWCVPTAIWIIMWYYDLIWLAPNLLPWDKSFLNNSDVDTMIDKIWKDLWWQCSSNWWYMDGLILQNWVNFAKEKWYKWSTINLTSRSSTSVTFVYDIISEIDAGRPIIVLSKDHAFVAYGYHNNPSSKIKTIRVNLWRWPDSKVIWSDWINYPTSRIDYNIDSLFYKWENRWTIKRTIKMQIKN